MSSSVFVMTRDFAAPRHLVWRTWTEADLVERWYGPGVDTINHEFNPVPGGFWRVEMRMGERSMYQRMEYIEVTPNEGLVMLMANADADWNVVASPMMPDWPKILLTTVTLEDHEGGTRLTLTWEPHDANDAETAAFAAAIPDLDKGWGAGMDIIAEILAELS